MERHEILMRRCFELARLGEGHVSPNPLVGAVIAHKGRIIGEGWHERYGGPHAEVNAVASVRDADRSLIAQSVLYCSLEPCFHYGKTPPCVELVLAQKIPEVVICNRDPNPLVAGQSVAKLKAAGVAVTEGVLAAEGARMNAPFFTWIARRRPYVRLKWAQSADGFIGKRGERTAISTSATLRWMHRLRYGSDAILVGTTTALTDDPRLDTRLYADKPLLRIALDFSGKIPVDAHLLDDSRPTWIIGGERPGDWKQTSFFPFSSSEWIPALLQQLREAGKAILLVEGGASVLHQWIESDCWDEIVVIQNEALRLRAGIPAPRLPASALPVGEERILSDRIVRYVR